MSFDPDNIPLFTGSAFKVAAKTAVAPVGVTDAWPSGWLDFGSVSDDGVSFSDNLSVEELRIWQSQTVVKRRVKARDFSVKVTLHEWTKDTVPFVFGGGAWSPVSGQAGTFRYGIASVPDLLEKQFGWEWVDGDGKIWRFVMPAGTISDKGDIAIKSDTWSPLPLTLGALGTDDADLAYFLSNALSLT